MKKFIFTILGLFCAGILTWVVIKPPNKLVIEELRFNINGVKQGVVAKYTDPSNTIVLFIHGGPGFTLTPFSHRYDHFFTKDFTVIHWDQRGSGLSFIEDLSEENYNMSLLVDDAQKIVDAVLNKFNQKKLLLVSHSLGSIIADELIMQHPEKYISYIAVAKLTDYSKAERIRLDFVLKTAAEKGEDRFIELAKKLKPLPLLDYKKMMLLSHLTFRLNGSWLNKTTKDMQEIIESSRLYSQQEKDNWFTKNHRPFEILVNMLKTYKAHAWVKSELPIYLVHGKHDHYTDYKLVKSFYDSLEDKSDIQFIEFENSAHMPFFEQPLKFLDVLIKAEAGI